MGREPVLHLIDDDGAIRDALGLAMALEGFNVRAHQSAENFLNTIQQDDRGCVVTDMRMPGMNGLDLLAAMNERGVVFPVIVITASDSVTEAVEVMKQGAFDYLKKPLDHGALFASVRAALELPREVSEDN